MAKGPQVAVTIAAVDQFTATMTRFRSEMDKLQGPLRKHQEAQRGQSDAMFGGDAFQRAQQRAIGLRSTLSSLTPSIAAVMGAGSVAGLGMMARDFTEAGLSLRNTASMAGMTTSRMNDLRGAARSFGLTAADADGAALGLNKTIQDAVYGKNAKAAAWFNRLGIDIGNMATGAKDAGEVMPKLIPFLTAANKMNPTAARDLADIFNVPASSLPMFIRGTDELERRMAAAHKLNQMTPDSVAAAEKYAEAYGNVETAGLGLRDMLMTRLGPSMAAGLTGMTAWVEANTRTEESIKKVTLAAEVLAGTALFAKIFGLKGLATVTGAALSVPGAVGLTVGAAGAYSGSRNLPMTDEMGNIIGNYGGDAGQKAWEEKNRALVGNGGKPWSPWGAIGGWLGLGGGGQTGAFGPSGNPADPRGIRNNNPLNLSYVPGQQGVVGSDGRFGKYGSMEDGVAAAHRQLQRYQDRGLTTVGAMIGRWAPPNENDTAGYVRSVAKRMGIDPSAPVDLRNVDQAAAMIGGMARVETGRELDPSVVRRGVQRALGVTPTEAAPEKPDLTRGGRVAAASPEEPDLTRGGRVSLNQPPPSMAPSVVRVDITHANPPDGTTLSARVDGDGAELGTVESKMRVGRSMPQQNWSRGY